ncbi:aminotransferase class IV [Anaerobaca lacustris]|uniref:branched-chain-amino-acid transaminase n=1 Tax=Anaerobaca lacustris TaxID=3044600 RepID=A0AAW6TRU4_9BACT|nr:aminotransferase class IV [Sedimentisphaerales bacterium M17dextr]
MPEKVFLNDKLVEIERAHVSVKDSGLLYGAGLFETMRSHNRVVFRLEDHLDRLLASAAALSIRHAFDREFLTKAIYEVLAANELTDARLRLTLTSGPVAETNERTEPTLLITATNLQGYPSEYYRTGAMVVLCPYRQNTTEPICGHKTTNYYPRLLALTLARQKGAAEALWFTTDNRLAEGCISNVFLVKGDALYTPSLATPVLAGIARKAVCRIADGESIELIEKDLHISDVLEADEILLTNVVMEVLPVVAVERHTIGDGKVGPITMRLRERFLQTIEDECRRKE